MSAAKKLSKSAGTYLESGRVTRVASEIARIQKTYGNSAMGVLSGASLTVEKAYLMGKFARVCLKTPYIDYNGRLCMVSAGAANKKAFGIDRTTSPWADTVTRSTNPMSVIESSSSGSLTRARQAQTSACLASADEAIFVTRPRC